MGDIVGSQHQVVFQKDGRAFAPMPKKSGSKSCSKTLMKLLVNKVMAKLFSFVGMNVWYETSALQVME